MDHQNYTCQCQAFLLVNIEQAVEDSTVYNEGTIVAQ